MGWLEHATLLWARKTWLTDRLRLRRYSPHAPGSLDGDLDSIAEFAFGAYRGAFEPRQREWEYRWLLGEVQRRRPETVMEIGTSRGGTLLGLCRAAPGTATVISVDLPAGVGGSGYPPWKAEVFQTFTKPDQDLHLLRADSSDPATLASVEAILDGRHLDFLLIDGDHSYDGVAADVDAYAPLVGEGGVVVLHDVVPSPWNPAIEVDRYWQDVHEGRPGTRLVQDPAEPNGYGFGVIEVGAT